MHIISSCIFIEAQKVFGSKFLFGRFVNGGMRKNLDNSDTKKIPENSNTYALYACLSNQPIQFANYNIVTTKRTSFETSVQLT